MFTNVFGDIRRSVKLPKQFETVYKEIVDNKFILVAYVGQGQNWVQKGPQKHSKFENLKFKPQYYRPGK